MRINHNIAALNTYRQLSNNGVQTNKALEKLSSGMRINRAGDDAAGLAISEKMRAQIRGLDQASRNAQDGISLIQTAEGALNETHSILQRMRELANQAASDTNVAVDREEIQKEINQLTSEINRIGNTTEFNTRALLSGKVNYTDAVTAKVTGGQVANNVEIIGAATKATATGDVLSGTGNLYAESGSKVTGDIAYTPAGAGPNVELTAAEVTGTTLADTAATITDFTGVTLTGTKNYGPDPTANDSGPNVTRTSAVANGTTALTGAPYDAVEIFDQNWDTVTGSTGNFTVSQLTASNNELTLTLDGVQKTVVFDVDDKTTVEALRSHIESTIQGADLTFAGINVVVDANDNIQFRVDEGKILTIDGGNFATTYIGATSAGSIAQNNELNLTVDGNDITVALTAGTYDLTQDGVAGNDRDEFLADLNGKLDAELAAGYVVASFNSDQLTFTHSKATEARSTIENISGSATSAIGLDSMSYTQGTGTELTLTLNGDTKTIYLDVDNYSAGNDNGADEFAVDLQAKIRALDPAGDWNNVTVTFNDNNEIQIEAAGASTFTIDGGAAKQYLLTTPATDTFGSDTIVANNTLSLTVNGVTKDITLANATYDLTANDGAGGNSDQGDFLADLQAKLDTAFGAGNITADFNGSDQLVLTNALEGTSSTITNIGGNAAATLGLGSAADAQGTENNQLTITYEGSTKTIVMDLNNYDGTPGNKVEDFLADMQDKLDTAFGVNKITVALNTSNEIEFTTENPGDAISIDGGGAVNHLVASGDTNDLNIDLSGAGNNELTLNVGGVTKTVQLAEGTYDFTNAGDRTTLTDDLNAKFDAAFGAGNVTAFFNGSNELVIRNELEGSESTLANVGGAAASVLGMGSADYAQGRNANNTSTMTVDGVDVNINLTAQTYTAGGLASDLQTQIRAADSSLANVTVNYANGAFTITSGAEGDDGSVVIAEDELAETLGLTASKGAQTTAGEDAKDNGLRLQVGANSAQSMTVDISDMRSLALKVSGSTSEGTVEAKDGKVAQYVKNTNVTNGTDNDNVEYALDVSTHEKATAALSVLDDAIATVSAERSKLGAFQNRLEHTINNLGTSSENLTAAESRIRDVDMAKEMMEFTKNNILSQAAQAMLAQANQQPQGVLQLLR